LINPFIGAFTLINAPTLILACFKLEPALVKVILPDLMLFGNSS
jgi:hypothetical protein